MNEDVYEWFRDDAVYCEVGTEMPLQSFCSRTSKNEKLNNAIYSNDVKCVSSIFIILCGSGTVINFTDISITEV